MTASATRRITTVLDSSAKSRLLVAFAVAAITVFLTFVTSSPLFAHPGHDHEDTPATQERLPQEPAPEQELRVAAVEDGTFREEDVAERLTLPTAFAFLPDGRVLITEKSGTVRVFKDGEVLPTPFLDIRSKVNDYWDRGLLGISVDKDFETNGYVYLVYTYENDASEYEGPKTARVVRVTASGDTAVPGSEKILLGTVNGRTCNDYPDGTDCIASDSQTHTVGNIKTASDGTLFVTTGDGADAGTVNDDAMRSQNPDLLTGKVLHIDRDGNGLPSNPFYTGDPDDNRSKVWALGLRNSFRFNLRPGTDVPYVGDVGWGGWEKVSAAPRGSNLGWPCYEATHIQDGYRNKPVCAALIEQGPSAVQFPLTEWPHDNPGGSAALGGTFYTGTSYPEQYRGAYFYGDYAQGFIRYLRVDENDEIVGEPAGFLTGLDGPVDIEMGPDGNLYYLSVIAGELRRIRYVAAGEDPVCPANQYRAEYFSNATLSGVPNIERCESAASSDWGEGGPGQGVGTDGFSVRWSGDFDFQEGSYTFRATADDGIRVFIDGEPVLDEWRDQGPTDFTATRNMTAGRHNVRVEYYENAGSALARFGWDETTPNAAPVPTIEAPLSTLRWKVGDEIPYSGAATDAEDGTIPASSLSWQVIIHHCEGGQCHSHFLENGTGANGIVTAPNHGEDEYYLEFVLTATDSRGKTGRTSVETRPLTVPVTLDSEPSGKQLLFGSETVTAPTTREVVAGSSFTIGAPSPQDEYAFESWSDGGTRQHDITVGDEAATYTATFADTTPSTCQKGQFEARYYSNKTLSGAPVTTRCEDSINNDWGEGGPDAGVGNDGFSVRWRGTFDFEAGDYSFTARADDGVRVYVDGVKVIDEWRDQGPTRFRKTVPMTAGEHEVRIEYYENLAGAVAQAGWKRTNISTDITCQNGEFKALYFDNMTLEGTPAFGRCESSIDNDWGADSPPGTNVGPDDFSVRWEGNFDFAAGEYEFFATADDGVRVFVDGEKIIDGWEVTGSERRLADRMLTAGTHTVRVEYYENGGGALARSGWTFIPPDVTPPSPVGSLDAQSGDGVVDLSWTNPADEDFEQVRILRSTTDYATNPSPSAGQSQVYEGAATSYRDTSLTNGTIYYYTVFARDESGNFSDAAKVQGKPVAPADTTPPQTTISGGPSGVVRARTATFGFSSSETGSTFECSLDGAAFTTCASPRNYSGLADGNHVFSVRAKDAAGNVDATPATREWTVDRTAPVIQNLNPAPDARIRNRAPTIGATVADAVRDLSSSDMKLYLDGNEISSFTYNRDTDRLRYTTETLSYATHTVKVVATDAAGNSTTKTWKFTVIR